MSFSTISSFGAAVFGVVLAAWVLMQSREQRVRWSFALGMLCLALEAVFSFLCIRAGSSIDLIQWEIWRLGALGVGAVPWLHFSLVYARGEDESKRLLWRIALAAFTVIPLVLCVVFGADFVVSIRPSEFGFLPTLALGPSAVTLQIAVMAATVLTLMNLERTYRASVGTLRWRIKYMILGLVVLMTVRLLTTTHGALYQTFNPRIDNLNTTGLLLGGLLVVRALLRTGQFEIELYPSQSVLRNSVTILLVGGYLAVAAVATKFISRTESEFDVPRAALVLVVALVVLLIALSSDRVRLVVLQFVSRHFQRPLYDYRSVWRQFTEATRSPRSQEELGRRIVFAAAEVFQVQSTSLWIHDESERTFRQIASTAQQRAQGEAVRPTEEETAELVRALIVHEDPVPIETSTEEWTVVLRRMHPAEFNHGGHRVAVALLHNGQPLGVLIVGDRIGGQEFRAQDFDMLRCVGDHVTASLLNVQLSRQLIQARELAAFQTMAAFFVHDLKNAASTLNLMLPNLRTHWDAPGFRDDALRGIAKTVDHINTLVSRLTQLRGELDVTPTLTDLNTYLVELLRNLKPKEGLTLDQDLQPLPTCLIDADQFRKVITNLVLNAYEATPAPGSVRVTAKADQGWVSLTVADTGRGMAPEFLQRSLFKPFQTTKKGGLGIGLFHTRMIVEAHGGRISVISQPGKGTTFTVVLPIRTPTLSTPS